MGWFSKKKKYAGMIGSNDRPLETNSKPKAKSEYHLFLEKQNEMLRYERDVAKAELCNTIITAANSQVKMDFNQEIIHIRLRDGWSILKICRDGKAKLSMAGSGRTFDFKFTIESLFEADSGLLDWLARIFTAGIATDGRGNWGEVRG